MGYLTVKGKMLTYSEYKSEIEKYKWRGLLEFLEIYRGQKDKHRGRKDLHWVKNLSTHCLFLMTENHKLQLTNRAFDLIHEFNEEHEGKEVDLHPEFGNWMVEAVPSHPYGAYEDLEDLLTCF